MAPFAFASAWTNQSRSDDGYLIITIGGSIAFFPDTNSFGHCTISQISRSWAKPTLKWNYAARRSQNRQNYVKGVESSSWTPNTAKNMPSTELGPAASPSVVKFALQIPSQATLPFPLTIPDQDDAKIDQYG